MNKLICIVGMPGSGKSVAADYLVEKGYNFFRFGQITLDIVKEKGLPPTEENERKIREEIRKKHGMGAYAILNLPKIESLLSQGNTVGDGLYSWDEYKVLKNKYKHNFYTIAIYAPPFIRHKRLSERKSGKEDPDLRHRPFTIEEAKKRDYAELENMDKGSPIAMADYTIINTTTKEYFISKLKQIIQDIEKQ